ncbi:peptide chain release factor N(5)-glutamine methyltransferase [Advenella incenata]
MALAITIESLTRTSGLPPLETRMLIGRTLGVSRSWMIAHDRDPLSNEQVVQIRALIERRVSGEPMAYIMGEREFMGLTFETSAAALIPRPETELLVETAIDYVREHPRANVLDLGTGTGVIAVSIARFCPGALVLATDKSPDALVLARRNAEKHRTAHVRFLESDWFDGIPQQAFDLIVSNPPYIRRHDPHLQQGDLRFEPPMALTDYSDGFAAIRRIIAGARAYLSNGGWMWIEHGWDQAEHVRYMLGKVGFKNIESRNDLSGIERISGGCFTI